MRKKKSDLHGCLDAFVDRSHKFFGFLGFLKPSQQFSRSSGASFSIASGISTKLLMIERIGSTSIRASHNCRHASSLVEKSRARCQAKFDVVRGSPSRPEGACGGSAVYL
jgi:hypothetical protein